MLKGFEFPIVAVSMDILWAHLGCQRVEWLRPESGVLCCWSGAVPGHLQSGNDIGGQRFGSPRACSLIAFAMIQSTFALWPSDMSALHASLPGQTPLVSLRCRGRTRRRWLMIPHPGDEPRPNGRRNRGPARGAAKIRPELVPEPLPPPPKPYAPPRATAKQRRRAGR